MDVLERLRKLLQERGWSEYRLAQVSGLNESTISIFTDATRCPRFPH